MNHAGKIPVNGSLHILQGPSTYSYADTDIGKSYALDLTDKNMTIIDAWNQATRDAFYYDSAVIGSQTLKNGAAYWPACHGDSLSQYSSPDPDDGLQYSQVQIFP